jgi:hypothetical protein
VKSASHQRTPIAVTGCPLAHQLGELYDRFPALAPEQAAQLICDAIRTRADHLGPHMGAFTELGYAISPGVAKAILGAAYRAFPDSAAARGEVEESESASVLQRAVAQMMRGAYW